MSKMLASGLTCTPSRCCLQMPAHRPGLLDRQVSFSTGFKPKEMRLIPRLESCHTHYLTGCRQRYNPRQTHLIRCAIGASYGDNDSNAIFPRMNVKDPYKRLGVSREASEYEIQSARNFLIQKYAGHKPSLDAIEAAHDKIIMQKFYDRKNPKIDVKKKLKQVTQSKVAQAVVNRFRTPSTKFIIKTSIAFLVLGVLTVLFPTDDGPTFQVALSLFTTIYFIHDRLRAKFRAFLYGVGAFIVSWLLGTFLMVAVVTRFPPLPLFRGALRSFELTTSLITYVFLWVSATYLK